MNTFQFPPKEIIDAAFLLSAWMAEHNKEYWQLGGVCDRRYAYRAEAAERYTPKPITWDGWYD